ncbi:hypothetical protein JHK86_031071 [Glycine max]|nr:hypothetical protein JHK86_031071 [Glycine max]
MEGLCSVEKYEEAKKLMFDMAYHGSKAQPVNFGVLMNDLGKRGKVEEAKALLHEMKKRGLNQILGDVCQMQQHTGWWLMVCARLGILSTDGACFVLEEMEKRKVEFDLERWETIIKSACSEDKGASELITVLTSPCI